MRLRHLLGFALLVIFELAPAASFAQFNQVPLISTSLGGIISGTNVYAKNISASSLTVGSCTGCGGGSVSGTTAAIKPGWPDILICNVTDPNWGTRYLRIGAENGVVEYHDFIGQSFVMYNNDKTFNSYGGSFSTSNCGVSIDTLVANGQAIFLNTSQWVVSGSTIYNTPFNVGIGTTHPNAKLEVAGTISAAALYVNGLAVNGGGDRITSGTTGMVAQTANGIISITTSNVNTGYFNANGVLTVPGISATQNLTSITTLYVSRKMGVNTTAPAASLDVSGSIRISTDGAICGSTIKGTLQYISQTLQICNGVSWSSIVTM